MQAAVASVVIHDANLLHLLLVLLVACTAIRILLHTSSESSHDTKKGSPSDTQATTASDLEDPYLDDNNNNNKTQQQQHHYTARTPLPCPPPCEVSCTSGDGAGTLSSWCHCMIPRHLSFHHPSSPGGKLHVPPPLARILQGVESQVHEAWRSMEKKYPLTILNFHYNPGLDSARPCPALRRFMEAGHQLGLSLDDGDDWSQHGVLGYHGTGLLSIPSILQGGFDPRRRRKGLYHEFFGREPVHSIHYASLQSSNRMVVVFILNGPHVTLNPCKYLGSSAHDYVTKQIRGRG